MTESTRFLVYSFLYLTGAVFLCTRDEWSKNRTLWHQIVCVGVLGAMLIYVVKYGLAVLIGDYFRLKSEKRIFFICVCSAAALCQWKALQMKQVQSDDEEMTAEFSVERRISSCRLSGERALED